MPGQARAMIPAMIARTPSTISEVDACRARPMTAAAHNPARPRWLVTVPSMGYRLDRSAGR